MRIFFNFQILAPESKDILMLICQVFFIFAIGMHVPITLFPSREQIYIYYGIERKGKTHFFLTLAMTLICVTIPTLYPDVIGLLGFVGGVTVGTSGYILPFLLMFRSLEKEHKWYEFKRFKYFLLFFLAIFLSCGSVYSSIFDVGHSAE